MADVWLSSDGPDQRVQGADGDENCTCNLLCACALACALSVALSQAAVHRQSPGLCLPGGVQQYLACKAAFQLPLGSLLFLRASGHAAGVPHHRRRQWHRPVCGSDVCQGGCRGHRHLLPQRGARRQCEALRFENSHDKHKINGFFESQSPSACSWTLPRFIQRVIQLNGSIVGDRIRMISRCHIRFQDSISERSKPAVLSSGASPRMQPAIY